MAYAYGAEDYAFAYGYDDTGYSDYGFGYGETNQWDAANSTPTTASPLAAQAAAMSASPALLQSASPVPPASPLPS